MIQVVNEQKIEGLLVWSSLALTPLLREDNTRSPSIVAITTFPFASKFTLPLMIWRLQKGLWYCPPLAEVSILGRTIPAVLLQLPQNNSIIFIKSYCFVPNNQALNYMYNILVMYYAFVPPCPYEVWLLTGLQLHLFKVLIGSQIVCLSFSKYQYNQTNIYLFLI